MKKYNVLCFLDTDGGRDPEILLPLIYFAENYLNCNVDFSFIWNIHEIYLKKPDIILMANTIGSNLHYEVTRYAHEHGIKIFALISEGIFRTDGSFNYFGYNKDKKFYQEYICHWSERTKLFFDKVLPELGERNVVTGATGFDRYVIYKFASKESFLKKRDLTGFRKVIGYAGWAFGKMYNKQGLEEIKYFHKDTSARIAWMEDQMHKVESILRSAIEANPDILFLLKRHPNEANPSITRENPNEMINLRDYPNVLYLKNEEKIHDLISISDIWTGFETTTCLEAWLMGKPTLFINPDPDFNRTNIYKGNPIVKSSEEFLHMIDSYFSTGELPGFDDPQTIKNREQVFRDTIGFTDGMNHLRAGYYLGKLLTEVEPGEGRKKQIKFSANYFIKYALLHIGKYFYIKQLFLKLPKFKKTIWIFENWKLSTVRMLQKEYKPYMEAFYRKNEIPEKFKDGSLWKQLFHESP